MKQIALRMPDELAERIDDARGMVPRERYLRGIIEQHLITSERAVEAALGTDAPRSVSSEPDNGTSNPAVGGSSSHRSSGAAGSTPAPAPPRASICKTHGQPIRRVGGRCNLIGCMG